MWTDERVETMTAAWAGGASASEIAAKLGGFEHTADRGKNAVLGKLHRLGLSRMPETTAQRDSRADRRRRRHQAYRAAAKRLQEVHPVETPAPRTTAVVLPPAATPETDVALVLSVLDLEYGHCRWPVSHAGGAGFCGCPAIEGKPYCPGHHERAHERRKPIPRPTYTHPSLRIFA